MADIKNRVVGAERLRQYWTTGPGALKIKWGTPGDYRRCVRELTPHMGVRSKGYCANLHKRANGMWPGEHKGKNPLGRG